MTEERILSSNVHVVFGFDDRHIEIKVRLPIIGSWIALRIEPNEIPIARDILEEAQGLLMKAVDVDKSVHDHLSAVARVVGRQPSKTATKEP